MMVKTVMSIIGWIILLAAFGSLGFTSDNPAVGVPVFTAFFLVVFGLVYFYVKTHQGKHETNVQAVNLITKLFGIILFLLALFSPIIALRKINLPFVYNLILFIATAILIVLGIFAVSLINNEKSKGFTSKLLGYLLLIIISGIPAFVATQFLMLYFANAYNALGTAYWAILSVATFSWWGLFLYFKKD
ncbi:MAG: hypothetical protein JW996_07315 [Candidatus Cloacimonetes bacterium]|nr:hypothetical protein [Candidatus Cloacimonadota bacterium]